MRTPPGQGVWSYMEGHSESSAAEQYGEVASLRARAANAISAGDYGAAIGFSTHALRLSHDALSQLDPDSPSAHPHQAMAYAVLSDLVAARAIAVEPEAPPEVTILELQVRTLVDRFGPPAYPALPRYCPHGLPSYDGECMRIPCPGA
jgi:hypothetical protein